jgi:hypothetical protein
MPERILQDFFHGRLAVRARLPVSGVSLFVPLNQTLRFWLSYDIFIGTTTKVTV